MNSFEKRKSDSKTVGLWNNYHVDLFKKTMFVSIIANICI